MDSTSTRTIPYKSIANCVAFCGEIQTRKAVKYDYKEKCVDNGAASTAR